MWRFRFSACVAGLFLTAGLSTPVKPAAADDAGPSALIRQYETGQETWQAFALRDTEPAVQQIHRHVLLVDTSASQVGFVREAGLRLVRNIANQLPPTDQIQLLAMDTSPQPLTNGFVTPVSADWSHAVKRLELRTPLGATNLRAALSVVVQQADGTPTSLLWIGDGISAIHTLNADEIANLSSQLSDAHIMAHSVVLGPNTNPELPAALANLTGGGVHRLTSAVSCAGQIATSLRSAGTEIQTLTTDGSPVVLANKRIWLRSERHAIAFRSGHLNHVSTIEAVLTDGRIVRWDDVVHETGGAEIRHLCERTQRTDGLVSSVASLAMLDRTAIEFQTLITTSATVAAKLQRMGHFRQAESVARRAAELDTDNVRVTTILTSLRSSGSLAQDGSADDGFKVSGDDQSDPLRQAAERIEARTQRLQQAVSAMIDEADTYAAGEPEYAESLLKDLLETVQSAHDVRPEAVEELQRRVVNAIAAVQNRREQAAQQQQLNAVRRAATESQEHLVAQHAVLESNLQTLIDQVRGLLDRGRHGDIDSYEDAEEAAREAIRKKPGNGPATQALMVSEAAGQLDKARRLRELRADRFLETLYQVELSHVPFPDEPAVQYPDSDVWRALSLARKEKYDSVSLYPQSRVEKWLNNRLKDPVPRLDYPGEISIGEILEYLADHYTAVYGNLGGSAGADYRMTIWPDDVALEIAGISSLDEVLISDINLEGIPLKTALKLIFRKTDDPRLTYVIQDDVMLITTEEEANSPESLVTRIYQVGDLVIEPRPPAGGGGMGGMGGGMMGGGMFSIPPEWKVLLEASTVGITNESLKKKQRR